MKQLPFNGSWKPPNVPLYPGPVTYCLVIFTSGILITPVLFIPFVLYLPAFVVQMYSLAIRVRSERADVEAKEILNKTQKIANDNREDIVNFKKEMRKIALGKFRNGFDTESASSIFRNRELCQLLFQNLPEENVEIVIERPLRVVPNDL